MEDKILRQNLVFKGEEFASQEEVLKFLADQLKDNGYVEDTYYENVLRREKTYPTGLDTGEIQVALPHTDTVHVKQAAIAVATLKNPIHFYNMAQPQEILSVRIVFMLAVKEPEKQVPLLTKLMSVFSDPEKLHQIYHSESSDEIYSILEKIL